MPSIRSAGVGSGLDIESLVTQLVDAERAPASTRFTREEVSLTAELSAFGTLKGALSSFQSSLGDLNRLATFGKRSASSSDSDVLGVSASNSAAAGNYSVKVNQLAEAHSLASGSYASADAVVGEGTLTLRFGTTDYTSPDPGPESYNGFTVNAERSTATITIDSSNNTLTGVRDAINAADADVSASIVNDGTGYRLLLSSNTTGADNSVEIVANDTDGNHTDSSGLSALAFNASATNLDQTAAASDAAFTVNGLAVTSSGNTVKNVIDGVNLTLKDVSGSSAVTVSVSEDRGAVKKAIDKFVAGYNGLISRVNSLTGYNPETQIAGPLQGDFSTRAVVSQIQNTLTRQVSGVSGAFSTLAELGITSKVDGTLEVDSSRIDDVLENNFDRLAGMFAAAGFPSDDQVTFVQAGNDMAAGEYAINITQAATKGQFTGSSVTFPLTIDADNDALTISVNGKSSNEITLSHGSYASAEALASELQSRINGDSELTDAGARVNVEFVGDHFEIRSNTYGSDSTVRIEAVDTNTAADLGFSVGNGTAGLDVEGTIGGVTATGSGQLLRGAVGSATEGLQLVVEGNATGDRGALQFSRGITEQFNTLVKGFLDNDGILKTRTDSLQSRVDDIKLEREELDRRMVVLEARYRSQFSALDTLMSQLNTTSTFLTQQLAALPEPNSIRRN